MGTTNTITIPRREVPVVYDADICVVGGSCTGVFAAVRASRLGARVAPGIVGRWREETAEAAGVTAYAALSTGLSVQQVPARDVRATLEKGGSIVF